MLPIFCSVFFKLCGDEDNFDDYDDDDVGHDDDDDGADDLMQL